MGVAACTIVLQIIITPYNFDILYRIMKCSNFVSLGNW